MEPCHARGPSVTPGTSDWSAGVVKDDADRVPVPLADAAHTVAHARPVEAPRAPNRALPDREDDAVALTERHDLDP